MRALICTLLTITLGVTAACLGESDVDLAPPTSQGRATPTTAPAAEEALVATAISATVEIFGDPEGASLITTIDAPADYPLVFAVVDRRDDMIEVQLPVRPNGASGWVRETEVELSATEYRVDINLSERRLVLLHVDDGEVMEETVAVDRESRDLILDAPLPVTERCEARRRWRTSVGQRGCQRP